MLARLLDAGLASADAALGAARRRPDRPGAARSRARGRRTRCADLRDDRGVLADRHLRVAAARRRAPARRRRRDPRAWTGRGARAADADGWLHTGDLGASTSDGRLAIIGRKADTIVTGGENVAPAEVEAALLEHPAVPTPACSRARTRSGGRRSSPQVVLRDGAEAPPDAAAGALRRAAGAVQGAQGVRVRRRAAARRRASCCAASSGYDGAGYVTSMPSRLGRGTEIIPAS